MRSLKDSRLLAVLAVAACSSPTAMEPEAIPAFSVTAKEIVAVEDTYLEENRPHMNRGGVDRLRVKGKEQTGRVHRALVRFDGTAIDAAVGSSSLTSATLELYVTEASGWGTTGRYVGVHRMTSAWTEGGATWACADDTDVSNAAVDCAPGDVWSMEGAGAPFASASDSVLVENDAEGTVLVLDVTADVQALLSGSDPNLGWILAKSDETSNGELDVSSRSGVVAPVLRLLSESQDTVPSTPPNLQPPELEVGLLSNTAGDLVSTTVLTVRFEPTATQTERQSAIDQVGGAVVGGFNYSGDGWYYVQVPGDGTTATTYQLSETLYALPQVVLAAPYTRFQVTPNHVSPDDGASWATADWDPDKTMAAGDNYNLEAINAPMAWGCTVGDASTVVAVIDQGFGNPSADEGNLTVAHGQNAGAGFHGQFVSSVLGAEGDNQAGITGMMWDGQVLGYEASQLNASGQVVINPTTGLPVMRDVDVHAQIVAATNAGAVAVNISLGKSWPAQPSTTADTLAALVYAEPLLAWLREGIRYGAGPRPLFVVSAGNFAQTQGQDAFWNGFPIAEGEFPDHVLVVGASDATGNLWADSKQSTTMVVAPGVNVFGLGSSGVTPTPGSGTSYAAPLVTGLAGLLSTFDPSLTTPELMEAIRQGATDGGSTAGGFPVVDAYASLKVASEEPGTPLCGNRTWVNGTSLIVQRGTGFETITPTVSPASLNVVRFHGGRRVDVQYYANGLQDERTFTYSTLGWTSLPIQPLPTPLEESRSGFGTFFPSASHDVDSQVLYFDDRTAGTVDFVRTPTATYSPVTVATFNGFIGANPAYSPLEHRGFIGIRATDATGVVDIQSVDLVTGASTVVAQTTAIPPAAPFYSPNVWLSVSEDGQELLVQKDRMDGTCELDFVGVNDGLTRFSTIVTPDAPGTNPPCGDLRGGFTAATSRTAISR